MVQIADKPFSQLTNLNILDELRIRGVLVDSAFLAVQRFTGSGTIEDTSDLILSTGTNTLVMPTERTEIIDIKSITGIITLDPGTNTVEGGNTITSTVSRRFYLNGTVWLEL